MCRRELPPYRHGTPHTRAGTGWQNAERQVQLAAKRGQAHIEQNTAGHAPPAYTDEDTAT